MQKEIIQEQIEKSINDARQQIIDIGEKIYKHPETGFKEFNTAKFVAQTFREMGLYCTELEDIPCVKATLDTGREGPNIAILGELDAVICPSHADADKKTGAVHACGHHVQVGAMIGSATGILHSNAKEYLSGKIHFIAVPAEEFIEMNYRMELRKNKIINYLGGKAELLHRGIFDDVDICMMIHMSSDNRKKFYFPKGSNGFLAKNIKYIGKASHAAGAPELGINALNAANMGLTAINYLRETFVEEDYIRFHAIITKGGDSVNVVPSEVMIEALLRGKSINAVIDTNNKVNKALIGGAISTGAKVEIEDIPGYFPFEPDQELIQISKKVLTSLINEEEYEETPHDAFSLDIGDLSTLMPTLHPFVAGAEGALHSDEYRIVDYDTAYILSSKFLAITAVELLWDHADIARNVVNQYKPIFSNKQEYFKFVNKLFSNRVFSDKNLIGL